MLCPVGDIGALIDAMRPVVADKQLRLRLADEARKLIEREYTFARRMQKVRTIYDAVLAERTSLPSPPPATEQTGS